MGSIPITCSKKHPTAQAVGCFFGKQAGIEQHGRPQATRATAASGGGRERVLAQRFEIFKQATRADNFGNRKRRQKTVRWTVF